MRITTLLCLASGAFAFASQGISEEIALAPTGLGVERYADAAKISGSLIAGLSIPGIKQADRPIVSAFVPVAWRGTTVCLEAVSQDGRYEASWEFLVAGDWTGGLSAVPLDTEHADYLSQADIGSLASLLRLGQCGDPSTVVAPASWNVHPKLKRDEMLFLQLNSFRADEVYIISPEGEELTCRATRDTHRIAYDFECQVPVSMIRNGGSEFEILRLKSGRVQRPESVTIVLPEEG